MAVQGYILTAAEGDMIDQLAWRHFGLGEESLPAILDANPGLSRAPVLPAGQQVNIPAHLLQKKSTSRRPTVALWD